MLQYPLKKKSSLSFSVTTTTGTCFVCSAAMKLSSNPSIFSTNTFAPLRMCEPSDCGTAPCAPASSRSITATFGKSLIAIPLPCGQRIHPTVTRTLLTRSDAKGRSRPYVQSLGDLGGWRRDITMSFSLLGIEAQKEGGGEPPPIFKGAGGD